MSTERPAGSSRRDLAGRDDIATLVRTFYARAFADPLIGTIFTDIARMDLEAHLPIMCDFWETVLFRSGAYRRNALEVHVALNALVTLTEEHFARWLQLWTATVDDLYAGEKAERAKLQADRIAGSLSRRLRGRSGSAHETVVIRGRYSEAGVPPLEPPSTASVPPPL